MSDAPTPAPRAPAPRAPAPRPGTVSGKTMALVVVGGLFTVFFVLALVALFAPREEGARGPGRRPVPMPTAPKVG